MSASSSTGSEPTSPPARSDTYSLPDVIDGEPSTHVSWFTCTCEWTTKFCEENHRATARVPLAVLAHYRVPSSTDQEGTALRMCCSLGHENVPAYYIGNYEIDGDHVEPDIPYCKPCGDSMIKTGEYGVTRTLARREGSTDA